MNDSEWTRVVKTLKGLWPTSKEWTEQNLNLWRRSFGRFELHAVSSALEGHKLHGSKFAPTMYEIDRLLRPPEDRPHVTFSEECHESFADSIRRQAGGEMDSWSDVRVVTEYHRAVSMHFGPETVSADRHRKYAEILERGWPEAKVAQLVLGGGGDVGGDD